MNLLEIGADGLDTGKPAFFRFRPLGDRVLLTNLEGRFVVLDDADFGRFARGEVEAGTPLFEQLSRENFLRESFDEAKAAAMIRARRRFLDAGPNLHVLVVTLRCNTTCVYCHASRANMDEVETDMTPEIAERAIDLILQTTSDYVTIEFQGGEPLVNFEVVKHAIEYALSKNASAGKQLEFTMVSNFALLDEEKLDYLLEHRVQLCTSIDGPADLHDSVRKLPRADGSAHGHAVRWTRRINERYRELGLEETLYHVEALVTVTRELLHRERELVDTYTELGCRALFLRPLDPFGFADKTQHLIEYPREDYLAFYRRTVDYIIERNKQGVEILERYAAIFLTKILNGEDPNFLDVRQPAGAGIGQLAYSYDGQIFTCDEGRMLDAMGDSSFRLGDVHMSSYRDLVGHETVRAVVLAGQLDGHPDCVHCAYNPYCGIPPVHSHKSQGSIWGRKRESSLCHVHKGILDYLFEKLATADQETLEVLQRWTTSRSRDHFLHRVTVGAV
ncbi:MAG: His-Xaa-Ser system radical SAM maturase HxsB [Deltaproteobacteria bacterium]|nr:His-Xaa-Ser system radical SAM maturase HxsB [Deltaproteobacteria bacterium]